MNKDNRKKITAFEKLKILAKALKVSFLTKSKMSLVTCILGFGMAFFPAIISVGLERFSNTIQNLHGTPENIIFAIELLTMLMVFYVLQLGYEFLSAYTLAKDKISTIKYIKKQIIECICRVSYSHVENDEKFREQIAFAESYAGGRVAESIQSVVCVLQYGITFISTAYLLAKVHLLIVVVLLVTCIPSVILAAIQKDETYRTSIKWMKEGVWVIHQFFMCCGTESLNEVRHLGIFPFLKERWRKYADEYREKKNELTKKHVIYNSIADILRNVVYIAVLLLAAREIYLHPAMGIGTFMLVLNASVQLQNVTAKIFTSAIQIYTDIYFMDDFFELEKLYENVQIEAKIPVTDYDIQFEKVNFSYPGKIEPALKDISVTINSGEKIAIVGENGSGKTTFVNLLCGLYKPQQGEIRIGGKELTGRLDVVRDFISVVFQDFGKYEESIRRNISVSDRREEGQDEHLYELLRLVGLDQFVKELPNQLDELDEPTAAMDPMEETELYQNFAEVTGDKTTLLISHRLGITRLVENGCHNELMEQNGEYA